MGYNRGLSSAEIGKLAERAGLAVLYVDESDNWSYAVVSACPTRVKE
jgi:poly(3-hydroxybutyrate) depolymerase